MAKGSGTRTVKVKRNLKRFLDDFLFQVTTESERNV